ncbi:MAG: hypothetical protein ACXACG_17550 [Candidatus Thorarchaeota archaeon]|jgi:hypothetical protein
MRVVGSASGINIHAPDDAYFSYFNSPYIGHNNGSAIDIYPRHQEWGGDVGSPVAGKIVRIKKMRMGQPKQFPTHDYDYGIGILPEESDADIIRVMHCEPTISEGEAVNLGDHLGRTIRSRYFNYWTGPHYHVEILPLESFERSRKSYPLKLEYEFEPTRPHSTHKSIEFLIDSVTNDRIIGFADKLEHSTIGDLSGLAATIKDYTVVGIIDGGLSHYKIGGVIGTSGLAVESQIHLLESPVGTVRVIKSGVSIFMRGPSITSFLDDIEIRGLSCFIYSKHYTRKKTPQLILIPQRYGQFKGLFNEGDSCEFRIASRNNMVKAE